MIAASLQSGSNGNCTFVQSGGTRLLFDAGISGKEAESRLRTLGHDIRQVDALVVSHDHRDHIASVGVFQRLFGMRLFATPRTLEAARRRIALGELGEVRFFRAGEAIAVGGIRIETLATPHDAADGSVFVVCAEGKRLGILTDLGHDFAELRALMPTLDAAFLESNYDPELLASGAYPAKLKRRITGPRGHLSNEQCASLVELGAAHRLRWVCLSHLSEQNNRPELALRAHQAAAADRVRLVVAPRYSASALLEL